MSQRPAWLELYMPRVLAGLILAASVLAMGETLLPDLFKQAFPHQTFAILSVAIGTAGAVALLSVIGNVPMKPENPQQCFSSGDSKHMKAFPLGGTNAL